MIINNLKLLDTEFNGLLTQLDRVLDKIETEFSVEDRMVYFKRLCPLAMSTIYRLFSIRRQIEQKEAANGASQDNEYSTQSSIENHLPFISARASPPDPISKSQQCEGCGGLSTKSKESSTSNDQSSNNDDQSSNNDDQSSNNDDQSSDNDDVSSNNDDESSNSDKSKKTQRNSQHRDLDNTNFTNSRVSISPRLQEVFTQCMRDPRDICSKIRRNPTQTAGGLPSAFLEIYERGEDAELLALYRRFELRNFYLLAVDLDYHTGERWCRNASSDLAKQIKSQRPSLGLGQDELKECLNKFVGLGRKYGRWATELGGPGYLLAMPLGITEREYTDRHYTKCIPPAISKFREDGIDEIVTENGFDQLGDFISNDLWTQFRPPQNSLRRRLTKSAKRSKKKRERSQIQIEDDESEANRQNSSKARRLEYRRSFEDLQCSTLEVTPQAVEESDSLFFGIPVNISKDQSALMPFSSHSDALDLMASIDPEARADFPDALDLMASIYPEARADFPDALDLMASIYPEARADFPNALDLMASIDPEARADFPDALDMMPPISCAASLDLALTDKPDTSRFMAQDEGDYHRNDGYFTGALLYT